jgi:hypothetical protein
MFSKKVIVCALATAALVCPAAASAVPADQVPPPPSSIAVSAADEYEQLRAPAVSPESGEAASSGGFDAVSGALGAAGGIALAIAAVALAGGLAHVRPPRHDVARS